MRDCFVHTFPGSLIELEFTGQENNFSEIQQIALILQAFDELKNVMQPLAADLQINCCDREFLFFDWQLESDPPLPHWHLRIKDIPTDLKLEPGYVNSQITEVEEISKANMMSWIEKALQQKCPNPKTHQICWNNIDIYAVRARIFDENLFREHQSLKVDYKLRTYELPFDRRNNGVWIYGSNNFKSEYPFTIQLYREFELLFIRISIRWSLWTEYGSPENIALSRAISRIVAKGWQVSSSMELFGI